MIPSGTPNLYDRYRPVVGACKMGWCLLQETSRIRHLAWRNRIKDYLALASHPERLPLHAKLSGILDRHRLEWPHYDYGEGYFYQGFPAIGVTGFRDTEARLRCYRVEEWALGSRVLDIGCNAGFILLSIATHIKEGKGIELNPFLVEIAKEVGAFQHHDHVGFQAEAFEHYSGDGGWDVVLSLANHSTFDGQTSQDIGSYFLKCAGLLKQDGFLLFESHAPGYESTEELAIVLQNIERYFDILWCEILSAGSFLDQGRTVLLARRRSLL